MILDYTFSTDTSYLTALFHERDRTKTLPFLFGLCERYRTLAVEAPIANFEGDRFTALLEKTNAAVVFLTPDFLKDPTLCGALHHLVRCDIPILLVHLAPAALSPGMQLQLSLCPAFYPDRHPTLQSAVTTLQNAPFLREAMA